MTSLSVTLQRRGFSARPSMSGESPYDFRPGGSLKLKGDGGKKYELPLASKTPYICCTDSRQCRKKSKSKADRDLVKESLKAELSKTEKSRSRDAGSPAGSPGPSSSSTGYKVVDQTDAQKRFEEIQRRRVSISVIQRFTHVSINLLAS